MLPGTLRFILKPFPHWENAVSGMNPGGISSSKVPEINAGLIGLKSPFVDGSESRCQFTGWFLSAAASGLPVWGAAQPGREGAGRQQTPCFVLVRTSLWGLSFGQEWHLCGTGWLQASPALS